ncbi:MAG: lysine--tRNA ligase [Planctomycetes bacterium]|nr:lysine--tRNA ligase [Planctomycetota bacterium]
MNEQQQQRIKNLEAVKVLGFDPFGVKFPATTAIKTIKDNYEESKTVTAAGRILAIRKHGKASFLDMKDWTGKIQVYIKKDKVGDKLFQLYETFDLGDIVGVKGALAKSKTGEITIFAEDFTMLSKSLLPLPEKWHGLTDVDLRYRQRYLDLIVNDEVLDVFLKRTKIINYIRNFMASKGFMEVETPMMHPIPGGATARPFITHHNTLDMDLYLRIAPELYLKRLLVGGMEKVYEINRNFRNEGIDTKHNPEFTMMEVYQAYGDYNDMMELTEQLFVNLSKEIHGAYKIKYGEKEIDFTPPWQRQSYMGLFQKYAGCNWEDTEKVLAKAKELRIDIKGKSADAIANDLFEKVVEPHLEGPVFLTQYPTAICPLTKAKAGTPEICERFEMFICGMEMANAFTELNDPLDQRKRFEEQLARKADGSVKLDEDFITAMEHGMPPAGGLGIGIDRLVMVLTNAPSIRDVILFPTLRDK